MNRLIGDRYRLLSHLGAGGMGTVWRARDELLHRDVAVKEVVLPPGLSEHERDQLRERTRREARAAARIDTPHAVTVYDVLEQDGQPFLVMELVEARTLSSVVAQEGALPFTRVAEVGLAVLSALEAAHAEGILHRDVKPGNVLMRADGGVVLSDFGIARAAGEASLTSTGLLLGSPSYIAPERARGNAPGPASDLWSLGATLFTAVEGRPAFDKGAPITTMTAVVTGDAAPYVLAGPLVPVLEGLLERNPLARLDAAEARTALHAVAAAGTSVFSVPARVPTATPTPTPTPTPDPTWRASRVRSGIGLAAGLVLIASAGAGGWIASHQDQGSQAAAAPASTHATDATPVVPADWQTYQGEGWSIRYPAGWTVSTYRGQTQLRDDATRRTVRVGPDSLAGGPLAALTTTAGTFASSHSGYQQLRLDQQGPGAVWEFTYSDSGADLHARDSAVVLGGRGFTVFTQAKKADWGPASDLLALVTASLQQKG